MNHKYQTLLYGTRFIVTAFSPQVTTKYSYLTTSKNESHKLRLQ